jgi:hypothetical protein
MGCETSAFTPLVVNKKVAPDIPLKLQLSIKPMSKLQENIAV